jgi:diguanylate cyclase (GGDEF)-like protein
MRRWKSAGPESRQALENREELGQPRDRLPASDATIHEQDPAIVELLSQIVNDNATLHTRLENAEGTLENQVAEISAYKNEARTDPMTGLANRRVFDEQLRDRLAEFQRNQVPVSILLIDIDHFRGFNNDYGHQAGDAVLTQVAHVLRSSMGENDLVSRIGGEEFVIIVAGDSSLSAQTLAEQARREIEQADFVFEDQHLQVTVSIGGAKSQSGENASTFVKRADVALYASKSAGRNIGHWHDGQESIPLTPGRKSCASVFGFSAAETTTPSESKDFGTVCSELRQRLVAFASEKR